MAKSDTDSDWFEVPDDKDWLPKFKSKQLKLLADAQVPEQVVEEISSAGISIKSLSPLARNRSDMAILQLAERNRRILLTLDRNFWNDRWYPLHVIQQGIIFVDEPPDEHDRILRAFGLLYGCFAKSYPLDWWSHMKARAVVGQFEIVLRSWEGRVIKYQMKLRNGYLVAKEA